MNNRMRLQILDNWHQDVVPSLCACVRASKQRQEKGQREQGDGYLHDGKVLNLVRDMVECLVHLHARLHHRHHPTVTQEKAQRG
jgi:hypothetical protein